MTITHLLEDFAQGTSGRGLEISQVMLEEERLSSFEQGYQAGWDDSLQASGSAEKEVMENISKALLDLSSSRSEIYAQLMTSMRPLIGNLIDSVLPVILRASLGVQIKSLIEDYIDRNECSEITISVAQDKADVVSMIEPHVGDLPVRFNQVAEIEASQVRISFSGTDEQEIDVEHLLNQIKQSVDQFFENDIRAMLEKS